MDRMRAIVANGTTLLFVSHNLKAVTEICPKSLLLEHGRVMAIDNTDVVVRKYLSDEDKAGETGNRPVYISSVKVRDVAGEQSTFESGETAWVDVEVMARKTEEKLAVVIYLLDHTEYEIFNTSTERLGYPAFTISPGQVYKCSFEIKINLAHGTFGLCVAIHRYDIQKTFDKKVPAVTLFVGSTMAVRGAVNCFPKIIESGLSESKPQEETARR
jgi:lipopolysaccharide transport system ATP-binding protein